MEYFDIAHSRRMGYYEHIYLQCIDIFYSKAVGYGSLKTMEFWTYYISILSCENNESILYINYIDIIHSKTNGILRTCLYVFYKQYINVIIENKGIGGYIDIIQRNGILLSYFLNIYVCQRNKYICHSHYAFKMGIINIV